MLTISYSKHNKKDDTYLGDLSPDLKGFSDNPANQTILTYKN